VELERKVRVHAFAANHFLRDVAGLRGSLKMALLLLLSLLLPAVTTAMGMNSCIDCS